MENSMLLKTLKEAFPGVSWSPAKYRTNEMDSTPEGVGIEAKFTSSIKVVCWEIYPNTEMRFLAIALDQEQNAVGRYLSDSAVKAVKSALLDSCIWLSSQTEHIVQVIGQGADASLLKKAMNG